MEKGRTLRKFVAAPPWSLSTTAARAGLGKWGRRVGVGGGGCECWGLICKLKGLLDSMVKIIFPSMAQIKSWR